jgi:rubredoxin
MSVLGTVYTKITGDIARNFDWHDNFEIYRCSQCGWVTSAAPDGAIGTAHAHAEKHTGFWSTANFEKLDQYIHKIKVTDFEEVKA